MLPPLRTSSTRLIKAAWRERYESADRPGALIEAPASVLGALRFQHLRGGGQMQRDQRHKGNLEIVVVVDDNFRVLPRRHAGIGDPGCGDIAVAIDAGFAG